MSRFVDTLLETVATRGQAKGIVTGEPGAPVRRTWAEVHEEARRMAGALVEGGLAPQSAVAVLAADPVLISPAIQAVWLSGGRPMKRASNSRTVVVGDRAAIRARGNRAKSR